MISIMIWHDHQLIGQLIGVQEKRDKFMSLAYQVNGTHYLGLDPEREPIQSEIEELYVNHSCDGNCWYMV